MKYLIGLFLIIVGCGIMKEKPTLADEGTDLNNILLKPDSSVVEFYIGDSVKIKSIANCIYEDEPIVLDLFKSRGNGFRLSINGRPNPRNTIGVFVDYLNRIPKSWSSINNSVKLLPVKDSIQLTPICGDIDCSAKFLNIVEKCSIISF